MNFLIITNSPNFNKSQIIQRESNEYERKIRHAEHSLLFGLKREDELKTSNYIRSINKNLDDLA